MLKKIYQSFEARIYKENEQNNNRYQDNITINCAKLEANSARSDLAYLQHNFPLLVQQNKMT